MLWSEIDCFHTIDKHIHEKLQKKKLLSVYFWSMCRWRGAILVFLTAGSLQIPQAGCGQGWSPPTSNSRSLARRNSMWSLLPRATPPPPSHLLLPLPAAQLPKMGHAALTAILKKEWYMLNNHIWERLSWMPESCGHDSTSVSTWQAQMDDSYYPICAEDGYPADVIVHKVISPPHILFLKSIQANKKIWRACLSKDNSAPIIANSLNTPPLSTKGEQQKKRDNSHTRIQAVSWIQKHPHGSWPGSPIGQQDSCRALDGHIGIIGTADWPLSLSRDVSILLGCCSLLLLLLLVLMLMLVLECLCSLGS